MRSERLSPAKPASSELAAMRRALVRWYRGHRRDLPWRRGCDPYCIWISEIMLQQTRVEAVVPYYERFLQRFPNVESLARAPLEVVLQAWAGLGYYTRARNLHAAAQLVVTRHAGRFPESEAHLLALPGIGRYTAGAIRSIAFGKRAPILDGNVVRVLSRLVALQEDVERPAAKRRLWELAQRWADSQLPGDANQALMELGATVCTKPNPDCERCPLRRECVARALGLERELPRPRRREASRVAYLAAGLVRRGARILLVRRDSGRLLRDWWELPICSTSPHAGRSRFMPDGDDAAVEALGSRLRGRLGLDVAALQTAVAVEHAVLQNQLRLLVLVGSPRGAVRSKRQHAEVDLEPEDERRTSAPMRGHATPIANLDLERLETRWVSPSECRALPLSTLTRKALRAAARRDSRWTEYLHGEPAE